MFKLLPGPYKQMIRQIWRFTLVALGSFFLYILAVYFNLFNLFGGMPSLKQLDNPRNELASEIISSDGVVLGSYFLENRSPVELQDISPNVINALIATEDVRFVKHSGIDPRGIGRSVAGMGKAGGGSTLTQQLVKNLFEARSERYKGILGDVPLVKLLIIKTKEWITAIQLERRYTKQEIMQMYLNTVEFSDNAYGIRTASLHYFSKEPSQLSVEEAAVLVGMCQNPDRFNPRMHPEASKNRRNIVMQQMVHYNFLSPSQYEGYQADPIALRLKSLNHNSNQAPYFIAVMRDRLLQEIEELNRQRSSDDPLDLYTSGLKIHVTIDSRMQRHAEDACMEHIQEQQRLFNAHWKGRNPWVDEGGRELKGFIENRIAPRTERYRTLKQSFGDDKEKIWKGLNTPVRMRIFSYRGERDTTMTPLDSIRYYKRFMHIGMMSEDPNTGQVKAWVGGINFKYFKFDHVKQSRRQPGSSFKPFVYATAIDKGYTPCDMVEDVATCIGNWCPKNYDGGASGRSMTLRQAIAKSVNTISVQLMKKFGAETIIEYAHRLGVKSPVPKDVTICLGTSDVNLFEMVNAYSTFVNGGVAWDEPQTILRIEDRYGNVLRKFEATTHDALSPETAWRMVYMLQGATQEPGGTSARLNREPCGQNNQIGGKTGTTSNYSDGWFMGVTQGLVTGVWVGGDERSIHFRTGALGQGGRMALPAWAKYMNRVYADRSIGLQKIPFKKPANDKVCDNPFGDRSYGDSTIVIPNEKRPADGELL
ncbi:transglycosylase domain-containing protein [Siphonobacter sp.]|uniref:transglycosylase domain-containing protein n=1 Tax=Siphonobacter sp. TaxID=1869184 RepID=UPI003B3A131B